MEPLEYIQARLEVVDRRIARLQPEYECLEREKAQLLSAEETYLRLSAKAQSGEIGKDRKVLLGLIAERDRIIAAIEDICWRLKLYDGSQEPAADNPKEVVSHD